MLRQILSPYNRPHIIPLIITGNGTSTTVNTKSDLVSVSGTGTGVYVLTLKDTGCRSFLLPVATCAAAGNVATYLTVTTTNKATIQVFDGSGSAADDTVYVWLVSFRGDFTGVKSPQSIVTSPAEQGRMVFIYVNESGTLIHGKKDVTMTGSAGIRTFTFKNPARNKIIAVANSATAGLTPSSVSITAASATAITARSYDETGSASANDGMVIYAFLHDDLSVMAGHRYRPVYSTQIGTRLDFIQGVRGASTTFTYTIGGTHHSQTSSGTGIAIHKFATGCLARLSKVSARIPLCVGTVGVASDDRVIMTAASCDSTHVAYTTVNGSGSAANLAANVIVAGFNSDYPM